MSNWREVTLGDLCTRVTVGHVGKMADEYVERGVPFLRSQNVRPFVIERSGMLQISETFHLRLRKSALRAGDVAVVRTGYPGTAAVIPADLDGSNCADLVVITPSKMINGHLLAAIFNSVWGKSAVSSQLVGSAQQHFNVGSAKSLRVRIPERDVQDKIASVICALNDLIENNRQRVEVLEETARTIYRVWFVQFHFPGHKNVELVDSAIGPIPSGWTVAPLKDVADIVMGQSPSSEFYNDKGIGQPFHQGVSDFGLHFPTTRKWCSADGRSARAGDVLISVRAPVGRINIADTSITIGRGLSAIRARDGRQGLLLGHLREAFAEEDTMGNDGAIFKSLGKAELAAVSVVVAPSDVADAANAMLADNLDLIHALSQSGRRLVELRDMLLPKLVSGQIDVSSLDLDALVEDSVA